MIKYKSVWNKNIASALLDISAGTPVAKATSSESLGGTLESQSHCISQVGHKCFS